MKHQWQSCINPWVKVPQFSWSRMSRIYWVSAMLHSIVHPVRQEEDPWFKTSLGDVSTKYHTYVAGEFYRIHFDAKSDLWKMPRGRGEVYKSARKMVSDEAELWVKTWQVLEGMESLGNLPPIPKLSSGLIPPPLSIVPLWFRVLVSEHELLMQNFSYFGEDEPDGAVAMRKKRQLQNRTLQGLNNPFCENYTQRLVDRAIRIADYHDQFRTELYMPMVRQRMKITARLITHSARTFDLNGKLKRQGRSKSK